MGLLLSSPEAGLLVKMARRLKLPLCPEHDFAITIDSGPGLQQSRHFFVGEFASERCPQQISP
jgi:hypothetical protein